MFSGSILSLKEPLHSRLWGIEGWYYPQYARLPAGSKPNIDHASFLNIAGLGSKPFLRRALHAASIDSLRTIAHGSQYFRFRHSQVMLLRTYRC